MTKNNNTKRVDEKMEDETLKVINQKIRELVQERSMVSINMALDLIKVISESKHSMSKTYIDELIEEASSKL